jgi:hypothetical protein
MLGRAVSIEPQSPVTVSQKREYFKELAPVPPRPLAHLRRWNDRKLIVTCFVEFNGKPVTSVKRGFRTAVGLAKLQGSVTPHALRHPAATDVPPVADALAHLLATARLGVLVRHRVEWTGCDSEFEGVVSRRPSSLHKPRARHDSH